MKTRLLTLIFALMASTLWAADFKSGELYYNITSTTAPYTVEVTYESTSQNYKNLTSIEIPASVNHDGIDYAVTGIGENAFYECRDLTSVTIPTSVTSIGNRSFNSCTALVSINLPSSIVNIGEGAFSRCKALTTSITIPESVTSIGKYAFSGCNELTTINLPENVSNIG